MRALFVAHGPAFKRGLRVPEFDNVDVYPLLAHLLDIAPQAERRPIRRCPRNARAELATAHFPLSRVAGEGWGEGNLVEAFRALALTLPSPQAGEENSGPSPASGEGKDSTRAREPLHDAAIARRDPLLVAMAEIAHDRLARHDDIAHEVRVAREDHVSIASSAPRPASSGESSSSTMKSARAPAFSAPTSTPAACAPPASASRSSVSPVCGDVRDALMLRWRVISRCPYSSQRSSSTTETEMWLSEPMPSARRPRRYALSGNKPSPRFASVVGQRPATAPLAASRRISFSVRCVACTRHQRASTGA